MTPSPPRSFFVDARTVRQFATGVGSYTAGLLGGLNQLIGDGEPLRVVALKLRDAEHPTWRELDHIEIIETPVDYESHPRGDWFLHAELPRLAKRKGCGAMVSPAFIAPLGPCDVRRVAVIHDLLAWDFPGDMPSGFRHYLKLMTRGAIARAEVVATSSAVTKRAIAHRFRRSAVFLPPAADDFLPSATGASRLPDNTAKEHPLLVYTASFNARKNHAVLLEACVELINRGREFQLALIQDAPAPPAIRAMAQRCGGRVRFVRPRSPRDVAAWTRSADAGVFPSRAEGFGIPMLEAMKSGVPLFAADIPAARWLTMEGRAAKLLPVDNPMPWADALDAFLSRRDTHSTERCNTALTRARQFSWKRTASRLIQSAFEDQ